MTSSLRMLLVARRIMHNGGQRHCTFTNPSLSSTPAEQNLSCLQRSYFTNTDQMKRDDPYAILGLQWGDGATLTEIQQAYRSKSLDLHPDRQMDPNKKRAATQKFAELQRAYQTLIKVHSNLNGISQEKDEEWRASVWRNGDRIAIHRTDVAGVQKKRPRPSAASAKQMQQFQLGHPSGRGVVQQRPAEYLSDGGGNGGDASAKPRTSSSVGRGLNKWVQPKEFQPWNGKTASLAAKRRSK